MFKAIRQVGPVVVTLGMLAYLAGFARLQIVTAGVDDFMRRSKAAIESLPLTVGAWEGRSVPLDTRARDLLQPNAEASLRYSMQRGGLRYEAHYSVIQVADARFMTGHAPVNCYPGNGWQIDKQVERVWRVGDQDVKGIEYVVTRPAAGGRLQRINIRNFFIFPDGHFGATLADLDDAAADYRKLKYGVTQVQLLTGPDLTDRQRDEVFSTLVGSERSLDMIRILRTGIGK